MSNGKTIEDYQQEILRLEKSNSELKAELSKSEKLVESLKNILLEETMIIPNTKGRCE